MPLEPQLQTVLEDAVTKLGTVSLNLRNTLAANGTAPPIVDASKQIEILQKFYAEISNYDRHYSITRSALTTLLVTVGLAASKDLFGQFGQIPNFATLTAPPCTWESSAELTVRLATSFFVPLLLFGLAIALNLHFQRLTYSCRLLEERIERLIASLMGRQPHAGVIRDTAAEQATGYEFRRELGDIYNRVHWPHFDLMARLLILGVILFCSYAFFVATAPCDRKWYWTAAILFGPAIIGYILVRLWNWWKD